MATGFADLLAAQGVWLGGRKRRAPPVEEDGGGGSRRFLELVEGRKRERWRSEFVRRVLLILAAADED